MERDPIFIGVEKAKTKTRKASATDISPDINSPVGHSFALVWLTRDLVLSLLLCFTTAKRTILETTFRKDSDQTAACTYLPLGDVEFVLPGCGRKGLLNKQLRF